MPCCLKYSYQALGRELNCSNVQLSTLLVQGFLSCKYSGWHTATQYSSNSLIASIPPQMPSPYKKAISTFWSSVKNGPTCSFISKLINGWAWLKPLSAGNSQREQKVGCEAILSTSTLSLCDIKLVVATSICLRISNTSR